MGVDVGVVACDDAVFGVGQAVGAGVVVVRVVFSEDLVLEDLLLLLGTLRRVGQVVLVHVLRVRSDVRVRVHDVRRIGVERVQRHRQVVALELLRLREQMRSHR